MKPNTPNSEFEPKTVAKLPGFGIVGRSVTQTASVAKTAPTLEQVRNIAAEIFESSTPSMVKGDPGEKGEKGEKGDKGDPGIPNSKVITIIVCTADGPEEIEVYAPE